MVDERPRLAASEIEAVLPAALQKLPSLRSAKSVRIRPYSGPKGIVTSALFTCQPRQASVGPHEQNQ